MKPIQVGLLGIGTVGSGTFKVLERNQNEIQRRAGRAIHITMVADLDGFHGINAFRTFKRSGGSIWSEAREVHAKWWRRR